MGMAELEEASDNAKDNCAYDSSIHNNMHLYNSNTRQYHCTAYYIQSVTFSGKRSPCNGFSNSDISRPLVENTESYIDSPPTTTPVGNRNNRQLREDVYKGIPFNYFVNTVYSSQDRR
jgi:hypothetical protein